VDTVRRLASESAEVLTLVVGRDADERARASIEEALRRSFPDLELEVVDGGQPGHPFLIGVE